MGDAGRFWNLGTQHPDQFHYLSEKCYYQQEQRHGRSQWKTCDPEKLILDEKYCHMSYTDVNNNYEKRGGDLL